MPMEYIVPSLRVVVLTEMTDVGAVEEILLQLIHLEEECFIAGFHKNVEKQRQKVWHDKHVKNKKFFSWRPCYYVWQQIFQAPRQAKDTLVRTICG